MGCKNCELLKLRIKLLNKELNFHKETNKRETKELFKRVKETDKELRKLL